MTEPQKEVLKPEEQVEEQNQEVEMRTVRQEQIPDQQLTMKQKKNPDSQDRARDPQPVNHEESKEIPASQKVTIEEKHL